MPEPWTRAEALFQELIERCEDGVEPDVESICAENPEVAVELRALYAEWERLGDLMHDASDAAPPPGEAPDDAPQRFLARIEGRAVPFERYKVRGEVGRGGMGVVLRVFDQDLRRSLAMKVLFHPDERARMGRSTLSSRILSRFLEEAQVTGQLDHPGIVPVHDVGVDREGRPFFTMRLVRGRDLGDVIARVHGKDQEWTITRGLNVLLKVCEAMAYAHDKGVVHRDLKPSNVMVGRYGEVYVMDWGLARVVGRPDTHARKVERGPEFASQALETERMTSRLAEHDSSLATRDGSVLGTPNYMPPEQASGDVRTVDERSDVYSLGAMLYHLLTNRAPYAAKGERARATDIVARVLEGPPVPIRSLVRTVPPDLEAICEKAMAREPSDRYAGMGALGEDLRAYLDDRVVRAHQTGAWAEFRKWVRRNRQLAAAVMLLVLFITVGSMLFAVYSNAKSHEVLAAEKSASSAADFLKSTWLSAEVFPFRHNAERLPEQGQAFSLTEMLENAQNRLDLGLLPDPLTEADMRYLIGMAQAGVGRLDESEENLRKAWKLRGEQLGNDARDTLEAQRGLVWVMTFQRRQKDAIAMAKECLETCRERFGEGDPATLEARMTLSVALHNAMRYEEALEVIAPAVEAFDAEQGRVDFAGYALRAQLASMMVKLGRSKEAAEVADRAMREAQARDPERNLLQGFARVACARAFMARSELEEAERIFKEGLDIIEEVSGTHSVHTQHFRSLHGHLLVRMKRVDEGLAEESQAITDASRFLNSEHHPAVARLRLEYAETLSELQRWKEALPVYERWQEDVTFEDPDDPPAENTKGYYGLGRCLEQAGGRQDEADRAYASAYETAQGISAKLGWDPGQAVLARARLAQERGDAAARERYLRTLGQELRDRPDEKLEKAAHEWAAKAGLEPDLERCLEAAR